MGDTSEALTFSNPPTIRPSVYPVKAYFLSQSLDVKTRREHECEMLRLYHDTLINHGVQPEEYSLLECVHLFQVRLAVREISIDGRL